MKEIAGSFLLFILTTICQAQKGHLNASFVLVTGDTLFGAVNERLLQDQVSPIVVVDLKTSEQKFLLPDQIKLVLFQNGETAYQLWKVKLDLSYIDKYDLVVKKEEITVDTSLLLQKIYSGTKLDLFYLHTESKEYYFVRAGGNMEELIIKYKTNDAWKVPSYVNLYRVPRYFILPYYRDQLLKYFEWRNNKKLASKINDLIYEKSKMLKIIQEIDKS